MIDFSAGAAVAATTGTTCAVDADANADAEAVGGRPVDAGPVALDPFKAFAPTIAPPPTKPMTRSAPMIIATAFDDFGATLRTSASAPWNVPTRAECPASIV